METKTIDANSSSSSCGVETSAAPEWLSKLENRREKLTRGKLGHEAGAGAPCNECGDKCPGLDLHFWRKVCRNCKCRKDQHMCTDENLSGWAQFEILGQIRSKPAFIKIKALANQPVFLEWVPPNASPDVVSDYMEKLGALQMPITGSEAAAKRKQQLAFQVPLHDLDASLCDNLTESESNQLLQYVEKIRENCVGQGNVVRVGQTGYALKGHVAKINKVDDFTEFKPAYLQVMEKLSMKPVLDSVLYTIFSKEKLKNAIVDETIFKFPKIFVAFSEPISEFPMDQEISSLLSEPTQIKLCGLDKKTVQSLIRNGLIYDKMLTVLKEKNYDVTRDPTLGPISDFRKEYLQNEQFKEEIDAVLNNDNHNKKGFITPIKNKSVPELPFNSPLVLKDPIQARFGSQIKQDTPIRKVKFGGVSTIAYDLGLPSCVEYEKDHMFAQIINSDELKKVLHSSKLGEPFDSVVLSSHSLKPDFIDKPTLSNSSKKILNDLGINSECLQSAILNGSYYDQLFNILDNKGIDFSECKLLSPLKRLREQLFENKALNSETREFVLQIPNSSSVAYEFLQNPLRTALTESNSTDSGFDSKPSTPSSGSNPPSLNIHNNLIANAGKYSSIPFIEEMNMYPEVKPSSLPHALQNLSFSEAASSEPVKFKLPPPILNCCDCKLPINFGEVAVKADRAGKEIAWHPECFKCLTCRELLADLVYFFHGGNVYCGRDLAIKLKIPRCKACDELIFTKEYTAAEGATFHIKHFCCYHCDSPLAGQQYIPDESSNMPLCLKCYNEFFAAACQRCCRPIGPSDQGVAWGDVHWHGSCFNCAGVNCAKSLIGGRFCVKKNMPFCSPTCVRSIIN